VGCPPLPKLNVEGSIPFARFLPWIDEPRIAPGQRTWPLLPRSARVLLQRSAAAPALVFSTVSAAVLGSGRESARIREFVEMWRFPEVKARLYFTNLS